jgi:Xaa-Pro aminopeptidase
MRKAIRTGWLWILLCSFALPAPAGPEASGPEVFQKRRKALARALDGSPVLIFGAETVQAYDPFRQSNRFYYLTGVEEPNAALLLVPAEKREVLFLEPADPRMLRWTGPRMEPGREARKKTGFEEIRLRDELPDVLDRLFMGKPSPSLYFPVSPEEIGRRIQDASAGPLTQRGKDPFDGGTWREDRIRNNLQLRYTNMEVLDASPVIRGMRQTKDPQEIAALREACRISALGMIEAIKATAAGKYEYQIEAEMLRFCRNAGGQGWAYAPIVGSGPNALIMHYDKSERKMEAGEVVLMDAGFFYRYYAADITRSFPVNGVFAPEHRRAYADLLAIQKEAVRRVKPGTTMIKLNAWVNRRLRAKGYARNLVHFLGHYVGMAVHDPGEMDDPLKPGHVITIEPGIYFYDKGFGMRIEDTVLVTPEGCEVLSARVPKEIEEIEALMKK